jgi:GNAT superfamily N-acetyltransferase
MTAADIPLGMRLKEQAGWNQIEADWVRFLDLEPEGCFVAELDAAPVGTVTTCTFGPVAWVAMVLVDTAVRGQGIGTRLVRHALDFLDGRGIRSGRLDATALGQPLYEKLGFRAEYRLTRFEGVVPPGPAPDGVMPAGRDDWAGLVALDRAMVRTERDKLLLRLFAERPEAVRMVRDDNGPKGYLTVRPGSRALHIGPCVTVAEAGPLLLGDAFHRYAGQRVYLDVPVDNTGARQMAESRGLTAQRDFIRMGRGPRVPELAAHIWASSGPEKG